MLIIPIGSEIFSKIILLSIYRCLEFLLQNDANPSIRDKEGYNSIHYAAAYGHRQCLELVSGSVLFSLTHTHAPLPEKANIHLAMPSLPP